MQQTDTTNILKGLKLLKWYTNSNSLLSILRTHTQCVSEDVLGFTAGQPKKLLKIRTGLLLERCGPRGHHRLTAIELLATGP